jgi:8-oxo-dGTP pyrophosphatase MutT (NUDIX family)
MHSFTMGKARKARRVDTRLRTSTRGLTTFVRLSQLRKLRECEQVAAVCYRICRENVEFLLVRTRGSGRWTFPKGNSEPGMTHAHAAALEAFEEAGVHGRIEEGSFARYFGRKRMLNSDQRSVEKKLLVNAHLCEVLRLSTPKESNRKRTWFSVEAARERLQEGRKRDEAAALACVLGKAVERIKIQQEAKYEEVRHANDSLNRGVRQRDPLNQVFLEPAAGRIARSNRQLPGSGIRHAYPPPGDLQSRKILECEVLEFADPRESSKSPEWFAGKKKPKALGSGARN